MLRELRIRNYAVIEELSLSLEPNLNVLTGETGAGKSIIVGALSLALGERATSDVVRSGETKSTIEGAFDISAREVILRLCRERGIDVDEGWLVLKREVQAEGRNRAWINGSPSTVGLLAEIGRALVDLHGQHEHQALLHAGPQREILDSFGQADELAVALADCWSELAEVRAARVELTEKKAQTEERADLLRHQLEEIEKAAVEDVEEDERLTVEERRLSHAEDLLERVSRLYEAVYASDGALFEGLGGLRRDLEAVVRVDPEASDDIGQLFDTAYYTLQELGERLRAYRSEIDLDPRRLQRVRERIDLLYRLKSKYGPTLREVRATADRARAELEALDVAGFELEELESREREARERLEDLARRLTAARREAAESLAREVTEQLPELGMPDGRFEVVLDPRDSIASTGAEEVEFRVSLNPGFESRPLSRVASGGELSRVMLALKTILAELDRTPTLIFDEIDAGIGGIVGQKVAARLHQVARHHQVFVITHLPQIAALADHHLLVTKDIDRRRAVTRVEELSGEERVRDIARMLGGDPEREASLEHARAILSAPVEGVRAGS